MMDKGADNSAADVNANLLGEGHTDLGPSFSQHSYGPNDGNPDLDEENYGIFAYGEADGSMDMVGFNCPIKDMDAGIFHRIKKIKKSKGKSKRRRTIRKRVSQLVYGDKGTNEGVSDFSISDEEIEQRNKSILKEAEATWEVSSVLGLSFDKNKQQMVEVFRVLEEEDRMDKGV